LCLSLPIRYLTGGSVQQDNWTLQHLNHLIDQFDVRVWFRLLVVVVPGSKQFSPQTEFKLERQRQQLYERFKETVLDLETWPSDQVEILQRSLLDLDVSEVLAIYHSFIGERSALSEIDRYGLRISRSLRRVRGETEAESIRLAVRFISILHQVVQS